MRTRWILPAIACASALAQPPKLSESCDLNVLGEKETASFLRFDRELRAALSRQDGGAMALLVRFPLRVNGDRGSWYVDDARSLQLRLAEIFPVPVRTAVLDEKVDAIACNFRGIMYGPGTVWVNPQAGSEGRYLVETVNLPGDGSAALNQRGVQELGCTEEQPPRGAKGRLEVQAKTEVGWWCR